MTFKEALFWFVLIIAVFIFLMVKSTWLHRIGYILLMVFYMPGEFEATRAWLQPFIDSHPALDFIYGPVFGWILLIYGIIGVPEAIMRILGDFTFREFIWEWIDRKIYVWRVLHDEKFGRKEIPTLRSGRQGHA